MANSFTIRVSTENGTGSMTANKLLTRILVSEGFNVSSKNMFPSNIAGLPTTYSIRISEYTEASHSDLTDLYIGFNKKTLTQDLIEIGPHAFCILNANLKAEHNRTDFIEIDCRKSVRELHESATTKKLLYNMLYVGSSLKLLNCSLERSLEKARSFFKRLPADVIEANLKALKTGYSLTKNNALATTLPKKVSASDKYIFEGNSCSALGFLDGGATVTTWYPITPSSSVAETFEKMSRQFKSDENYRSVLQCEDEISSAVAALGAGWSGARAFTATSGPGVSLMQEAIGLGYFSESPFVILDVQRAGPSTGLPTRTSQADLMLAHYSSHGDTLHPVLLPGTPQEAYDDSFESLNIAESLQTPVFVLSDLDLGMNEWVCNKPIVQKQKILDRGSVEIKNNSDFKRYSNKSPVATRSLPRISDESLAYFTRGTGHDEDGTYSEKPDVFKNKLRRLKIKIESSKNTNSHYPKDITKLKSKSPYSIVLWGSSGQIEEELLDLLPFEVSYLRLRSLPLSSEVYDFLDQHEINFVIEQNRDGQMNKIIKSSSPIQVNTKSITQFNGLPLNAENTAKLILEEIRSYEQS